MEIFKIKAHKKGERKLIYTITLNPALDYILKHQTFKTGEINRSEQEIILPGGKGINVTIILKALEIDSTVLGYKAGFIGEEIEKEVQKYGIQTDFIKIEKGTTRINIKIMTETEETAINAQGPTVEPEELQALYKKIENIQSGDWAILSGSIPQGLPDDTYENICKKLQGKEVKIVIDATGELLKKTLKYKPFLIKPNKEELGEIFNTKIETTNQILEYSQKLQQEGAQNILVSLGKEGAILLDETGKIHQKENIKTIKRINTVGAGDSMVAGFIAGYTQFQNYEKALQMGMAAGTATANSLYLATKNEIYEIFNQIK